MVQALGGLRVLDLSRICGSLRRRCSDLGADVVKVESKSGDTQNWGPPFVELEMSISIFRIL